MNIEEFENNYRRTIDESLNELQTVVLLTAHLQHRITIIGQSLQNLSQTVEEFIAEQKTE